MSKHPSWVKNWRGGIQHIPRPPRAALGAQAPWAQLPAHALNPSLEQITHAVQNYEPQERKRHLVTSTSDSAVLMLLWEASLNTQAPNTQSTEAQKGPLDRHSSPTAKAATHTQLAQRPPAQNLPASSSVPSRQVELLVTRRSPHLRHHAHQIAFPGGKYEPQDFDVAATALRESNEETNLNPDEVEVIGQLDHFVTFSSESKVYPFVALSAGPPKNLRANPEEVEKIRHVSISELLQPEVWRQEIWPIPGRGEIRVTFFELEGDTIWGATANMLAQLLRLVLGLKRA